MGKYLNIDTRIFSIFGSDAWLSESVKTYPCNFIKLDSTVPYIRISIIPSGIGVNKNSVSGVLIADIFIPNGSGPKAASTIADKLDTHLINKTFEIAEGVSTQFFNSTHSLVGTDVDNSALYRTTYTIPFNYNEV